jgi:hypothetical protein
MGNTQIVQILNRRCHLFDHYCGFMLTQLSLLQPLIKSASIHILQYYVQMRFVIEKTVHAQYIAMIDATLQPELQGQLLHHHM